MIVDLPRFVHAEKPYWDELEATLRKLEEEPEGRLPLSGVERLHYLYERSSAGLVRLGAFGADPGLRETLESLVARAYSQIHEARAPLSIRWKDVLFAFPRAFRRHSMSFRVAAAITMLGCLFGAAVIRQNPRNKAALMPFPGLMVSPAERVAAEERSQPDRMQGVKATFSAQLMTNNIRVTIFAMALGMTFGAGTVMVLFWNGVILGAVMLDYIAAKQAVFLAGWLLPHGSIEIPAILFGGQAGLVLAGALIGWGSPLTRPERLRAVTYDLFVIVSGAAVLLVWAGIVESFVSQYHQPVIPYSLKITFGICEMAALAGYLAFAGRHVDPK